MESSGQMDRAALDTWAIVEMFGHKRIAGKISEHVLGSAVLVRVDVPELVLPRRGGLNGETVTSPAFTKLIGPSSIYALTPCSEDVARRAAQSFLQWDPPIPVEFQPQLPARASATADEDLDAADDYDLQGLHDNEGEGAGDTDDVTDTPADREDDRDQHPFAGDVERPRSLDAEASLPR